MHVMEWTSFLLLISKLQNMNESNPLKRFENQFFCNFTREKGVYAKFTKILKLQKLPLKVCEISIFFLVIVVD